MGGVDLGAGAVGPLPNLLDMGSLGVILSKLSVDNSLLFKAKSERDISVQIGLYSNPMSKRAIEHNMRLGDVITDMVASLTFGGQVLQATPPTSTRSTRPLGW